MEDDAISSRIVLHLRSVADAPALKKSKFQISGSKCVAEVSNNVATQK